MAFYYTLADLVLLGQCFYYEGFTLKDKVSKPVDEPHRPNERTSLLRADNQLAPTISAASYERRSSLSSFTERLLSVDATHLSPATPLVSRVISEEPQPPPPPPPPARGAAFNLLAILMVCAAGVLGWWLGNRDSSNSSPDKPEQESLEFNILGQVFGYICAALYLVSRVPQLLLNYRRKSTEGISMLFFLFACIGNLTYTLSILAYEPVCEKPRHCKPGETPSIYWKYFLINFSWLLGALGSLLLDLGVFVQYFMYKKDDDYLSGEDDVEQEQDVEPMLVSRNSNQRRDVAYEGA